MEIINFIGGIIILVFVLSLRSRIAMIEKSISNKVSNNNLNTASISKESKDEKISPEASSQVSGDLIDYIKKEIDQGVEESKIKDSLIANGWILSDVEKAISSISLSKNPDQSRENIELKADSTSLIDSFAEWFKEDWLLKLGALLLLIGFGWLTTYAFLNNWIGPMGRIVVGIVAGSIFMLFGRQRIKNYVYQGGVFLVLGSTVVLITVFAARELYGFFTPLSALLIMFLSTAFIALVSVEYNRKTLSFVGLALAGVAPLLTDISSLGEVWLFWYLFVVVIGTIWIVILTRRSELTFAALILVLFYSLPYLIFPDLVFAGSNTEIILLFIYAFAALFFLTNTISILKSKTNEIKADLITAFGNGLLLLAWIMEAGQNEWKSLIISAWMIVFIAGAFIISRKMQRLEPFYVYAGVGVMMLIAATFAELEGAALVVAYTIESGLVTLISYLVLKNINVAKYTSILFAIPIILSFDSIFSREWDMGAIHKDFFVILFLGAMLLSLGLFFFSCKRDTDNEEFGQLIPTLLIIGSIYMYVLLWLSLHSELMENVAVMISLAVYTVIGIASYFYGSVNGRNSLRAYGGALIVFVVSRLFLVDIWNMEMSGRIVVFFLIGALLVSTAFLSKNKKEPSIVNKI